MEKEHNEEIDLQDLTVKAIRFVTKNFRFILIWAVIGLSISLLYRFLSPTIYDSRMILSSDILTESYCKVITASVKNLIYEENYSSLGTLLGISEEDARGLKTFDIKTDTVKERDRTIIVVSINTRRSEPLPKLQAGVIRLLQNNEFVTIRVHQRQEVYKHMIDKIGKEINSLDSLKKSLFFGSSRPKNSETLFVDPTGIYSQLINLYKERLDYKNALELSESVQLIEGFIVSKKLPKTRSVTLMFLGVMGGLSIAFILLILSPLYKLSNKTSS